MSEASVAVLDLGKTNLKLSAVTPEGAVAETLSAANLSRAGPPWRHPDLAGAGVWLMDGLAALARRHPLRAVVPVGHGAAGALVGADPDAGGDGCALPMVDYEDAVPPEVDADYRRMAGDFADRGSGIWPGATHQARQMLWMERAEPAAFGAARWFLGLPQYWAWRLSGRAVAEASHLAAQSHLWNVPERRWAQIVAARGWDRLMPPVVPAWEDLGEVRPALAARHGLPPGLRVLAGAHDSSVNAYRYAAAGRGDLAVVSTGTWVVALAGGLPLGRIEEARGLTLNADLWGRSVGGALAMAGREWARLAGGGEGRATEADLGRVVGAGTMALPSFVDWDGVFPGSAGRGRIEGPAPEGPGGSRALALLYAALVTRACLDALDPGRPAVVDGTFLRDPLFAPLLAALRPGAGVLTSAEPYGIAAGGALLAGHAARRAPAGIPLARAAPLRVPGLDDYARRWAGLCARGPR